MTKDNNLPKKIDDPSLLKLVGDKISKMEKIKTGLTMDKGKISFSFKYKMDGENYLITVEYDKYKKFNLKYELIDKTKKIKKSDGVIVEKGKNNKLVR